MDKHDGNGWTDISGAVQASYTKQAVDNDCDGFQYKCVVSNSAGSVESNVATLHVNEKSSDGGSDNSGDKKADKDSNSSGDNSVNNSDSNTGNNNSNISSNNNIMKRTGEKDDVPKTGDDTSIGWLFVVMIASGTGVIFSRKKREMSRG